MARWRLNRRFPPTREGWWFLIATLLVGAAAVNGGINLLFLVFGMMIFLILASGVMSELSLRRLTVTRRIPAAIHARAPFLMGIAVRNDKRRLPTFSLEVEDLLDARPVERRCYYLKLPAGRTQETAYRNTLPRRGLYHLTGFRLSTRFPFGLIRKSRDVDGSAQLLVYPELVPVPEGHLSIFATTSGRQQAQRLARRGDFHGLRPYRSSDDPRDIHWKVSAKRGAPFVRESEDETGHAVVVVLENERATPTAGAPGEPPFEAAVSLAASLALALLRRGLAVGLATHDGFLAPAEGPIHRAALLRALALIAPRPGAAASLPGGGGWPTVHVRPGPGGATIERQGTRGVRRSA
jgi:uncharacterized protein (DUF58 family)